MAVANNDTDRSGLLSVWLEPTPETAVRVGSLVRETDGTVKFVVAESYIELGPARPILSSAWRQVGDEEITITRLRKSSDKIAHGGLIPGWFSNLLPEGALRTIVERRLSTGRHDDFDIIGLLGGDLPGAVVVRDESGAVSQENVTALAAQSPELPPATPPIRFSLAGIQLKFSMSAANDRLTVPGLAGNGAIIVKLPNKRYPHMPELEFSAMRLAETAGVQVASCRLVPSSHAEGLPKEWLREGDWILAVDRFDRIVDSGNRRRKIHIEDFAQIIGAIGDRKYTMANEETNLKLISRFVERDSAGAVLQAVRRIVVNILLGNTDAHLKNWSLMYEGNRTTLSPAYDIFPTYVYAGDPTMALAFGGTKTAALITYHQFSRAAGFVEMDPKALTQEAKETVEQAADVWPSLLPGLPIPKIFLDRLRQRWETLALTNSIGNGFGITPQGGTPITAGNAGVSD